MVIRMFSVVRASNLEIVVGRNSWMVLADSFLVQFRFPLISIIFEMQKITNSSAFGGKSQFPELTVGIGQVIEFKCFECSSQKNLLVYSESVRVFGHTFSLDFRL